MKTFKLVSGIICCVLSVLVMLQSCAAGLSNSLAENGEVGGSAGLLVAILLLAGGIVMIATRMRPGKGGSVAGAVIFILAALLGFANAGSYADLNIWSGLCLILGIVNVVSAVKANKPEQ